MELTGPIQALTYLKSTSGSLAVYTDSTYVIRGIREWIPNWQRRGWRTTEGKDVLNRELWETLWNLVQDRSDRVEWHYVRGHIGIPGTSVLTKLQQRLRRTKIPGLYEGPVRRISGSYFDIPDDTNLPTSSGSSRSKNAKAYSYLSVVDGVPKRHTNWTDCEQRVKGRSNARFKKAISADDEVAILKSWGVKF
jgi:ribonuclease HI